jgi:peptidyl-prolyl cis-trans isomerase A (cyclophilin A)
MTHFSNLRRQVTAAAMSFLRAAGIAFAPSHRHIAFFHLRWIVVAWVAALSSAEQSRATIIRFNTAYGNVDVRLYNTATPLSVANFLNYVNSGRFAESIIHRSIPGFIIQGGGFYYPTPSGSLNSIPTYPAVMNEYGISNLRGTLAYAKIGPPEGQPPTQETINSATSGWFFNLNDNSSNLNNQNGGFTVFGRVLGTGMNVVDDIADLDIVNAGSPFDNLPIVDLAAVQARGSVIKSDLVFVHSISVRNLPAGDYNFDGTVNNADYGVWKSTFGSTTKAEADGNGDGIVNAADYTVWRNSFGQTSIPGGGSGALGTDAVPEPVSVLLVGAAATTCLACLPRRLSISFRHGPIE